MTLPASHRVPRCTWCRTRPAPHTRLCDTCTTTLRTAARMIGELNPQLEVVETRQTRYSATALGGGKGIGKAQPLPIDMRFADHDGRGTQLVNDTRTTLVAWCRVLVDEWPLGDGHLPICDGLCNHETCVAVRRRTPPGDTITGMCAYLIRMTGAIANSDWAPDCLEDLLGLERRHKQLVDRPADRWYAGICNAIITPEEDARPHDGTTCGCACHNAAAGLIPCDIPGGCGLEYSTLAPSAAEHCTRVLEATPGEKFVTCRACDAKHPVEERRAALLREAQDHEATVVVLTRIVTTLMGWDVSESRLNDKIRRWSEKDRIASHGQRVVAGRPRPTYRVGDVVRLLAEDAQLRSTTKAG